MKGGGPEKEERGSFECLANVIVQMCQSPLLLVVCSYLLVQIGHRSVNTIFNRYKWCT